MQTNHVKTLNLFVWYARRLYSFYSYSNNNNSFVLQVHVTVKHELIYTHIVASIKCEQKHVITHIVSQSVIKTLNSDYANT